MFILVGLIITVVGLFFVEHSVRLRTKGIFTIGTVTKVQIRHRGANVFISFKTLRKKLVVFQAGGWTSIDTSPFYQVGNQVPVLYDPTNPRDAIIYTFDFVWFFPFAISGLGLFLIYYGFTH